MTSTIDLDKDVASDTFLAGMPDWLRWLLFIPAAVICALIVPALIYLLNSNISSETLNNGWARLIQSFAFGAAFVLAGSYSAPKKQLIVSIALTVVFSIIVSLLVAYSIILSSEADWYLLLHGGVSIAGAGVGIASIYDLIT